MSKLKEDAIAAAKANAIALKEALNNRINSNLEKQKSSDAPMSLDFVIADFADDIDTLEKTIAGVTANPPPNDDGSYLASLQEKLTVLKTQQQEFITLQDEIDALSARSTELEAGVPHQGRSSDRFPGEPC